MVDKRSLVIHRDGLTVYRQSSIQVLPTWQQPNWKSNPQPLHHKSDTVSPKRFGAIQYNTMENLHSKTDK